MFSRRSFFAALGLALPLVAATTAEAATRKRTPRTRRAGAAGAASASKTPRQRRVDAETAPAAKG